MNYRDDVVDVVVIADSTQSTLKMSVSERITSTDNIASQNSDVVNDNIAVQDTLFDSTKQTADDMVQINDVISDKKTRRELITDTITISDNAYRLYRDFLTDSIIAKDNISQKLSAKALAFVTEQLTVKDTNYHTIKDAVIDSIGINSDIGANRHIADKLGDKLHIKDTLRFTIKDAPSDTLVVADTLTDKQHAKNTLVAKISVGDGINEKFSKRTNASDTIKIADEIWDRLTAKDLVSERAMIAVVDKITGDDKAIAWTMNTVNQAMSQYNPYDVNRLSVINGVLYGECDDGVYRLDSVDETIMGILVTDKIDYGENLIKPAYAYTEYQTDGIIKLAVHTTQKGVMQSYTYTLPKERAGELTNGRFVFGRGLYGRQFAYTLTITARTAFIHDLNIHFEKTARRL